MLLRAEPWLRYRPYCNHISDHPSCHSQAIAKRMKKSPPPTARRTTTAPTDRNRGKPFTMRSISGFHSDSGRTGYSLALVALPKRGAGVGLN
jgi:hypothetical protein